MFKGASVFEIPKARADYALLRFQEVLLSLELS